MKIIIKESRLKKLMFQYLEEKLYPHNEIKLPKYHESTIFWVKNGQILAKFERTIFNRYKFIIHKDIFSSLQNIFSLYKDINAEDVIYDFIIEKNIVENIVAVEVHGFVIAQEDYDKLNNKR